MVRAMNKKLISKDVLARNLKMLLDAEEIGMTKEHLSRKSGVSVRMINYILKKDRAPTIDVIDNIASAFHLTAWELLTPNLDVSLVKSRRLEKLVNNYASASIEGRTFIDHVAEKEAIYKGNQ